jgi:hypothetical protein
MEILGKIGESLARKNKWEEINAKVPICRFLTG